MFNDCSHSNSSRLLTWFINLCILNQTILLYFRLSSLIFLWSFFHWVISFFVSWFCYIQRFLIHILNEVQNCRVTKSSYEIESPKMTSHFELLTQRLHFYFFTFELLTRSQKKEKIMRVTNSIVKLFLNFESLTWG